MTLTTELLAPARDLACGRAAIDAGADAVYIGAPQFGARSRAGNDLADIAALVAHAHVYWARVYVTVNTLLYDDELPQAVKLIHDLHDIGVDAVIVQDVGLLECELPPIPLIASTQMHNATPERVRFLEEVGFRRAILARELTLEEIRAIRAATERIELEVFVHGALCISYSGQCYMSYAVGGRSGNRGECAQPCRRSYSLLDRTGRVLIRDRYLLSLRDMRRLDDLGALLDVGVSSFKIEGRLKDALYVTTVVSAYRQRLDRELAARGRRRSSSGQSHVAFDPDVGKVFNRGFTPYFLHGRETPPSAIDTPKMVGEALGTVTSTTAKTFTLKTDAVLQNGDGLAFFDPEQQLAGTVVNDAHRTRQGLVVTPNAMEGIRVGAQIHRNHDRAYLDLVVQNSPERTLGVTFRLAETRDGLTLQVIDEDGNAAVVTWQDEKVPAHKPARANETARRQLSKTGGTTYRCEDVTLDWSDPWFLTTAQLNALRRAALERLTLVREEKRPTQVGQVERNSVPYPEQTLTFRANALNAKAIAFYQRHGVSPIEAAAESGLDMTGREVMVTRMCIRESLGWCPHQASAPKLAEPLTLVDEDGRHYALRFRCAGYPHDCGMEVVYGDAKSRRLPP